MALLPSFRVLEINQNATNMIVKKNRLIEIDVFILDQNQIKIKT